MAKYQLFNDPARYINTDLFLTIEVGGGPQTVGFYGTGEGAYSTLNGIFTIEATLINGEVVDLHTFEPGTTREEATAKLHEFVANLQM